MYLIVGGVGNGAAEEDWHWGLNPGMAAIPEGGSCSFGRVGWDHVAWARVKTTQLCGAPFCHVA